MLKWVYIVGWLNYAHLSIALVTVYTCLHSIYLYTCIICTVNYCLMSQSKLLSKQFLQQKCAAAAGIYSDILNFTHTQAFFCDLLPIVLNAQSRRSRGCALEHLESLGTSMFMKGPIVRKFMQE